MREFTIHYRDPERTEVTLADRWEIVGDNYVIYTTSNAGQTDERVIPRSQVIYIEPTSPPWGQAEWGRRRV